MDAREAGRFLIVGFPGPEIDADLRRLVREEGVAGVILFRRNIESLEGLVGLVRALRALREEPLLIAIDHEGGRVLRVPEPFTQLPSFRALGRIGEEETALAWGRLVARELLACGIDLDFAPVMDVDSNPENPVIGDRALSADPREVSRLGCAAIRGMHSEELLACAKHFPGHGDTVQDSHITLPRVDRPRERLEAVELPPFEAACRAGVDALMTAHVVYPALDPAAPATLSPGIITGIARGCWGYDGALVSDDLEMAAIAGRLGAGEAAVLAVWAGCDLALVCHRADRQFEALDHLRRAIEGGFLPPERVESSVLRVQTLQLAARGGVPDLVEARRVLGCAEHRALRDRMKRALTGD